MHRDEATPSHGAGHSLAGVNSYVVGPPVQLVRERRVPLDLPPASVSSTPSPARPPRARAFDFDHDGGELVPDFVPT
jgi:hypothetical protein